MWVNFYREYHGHSDFQPLILVSFLVNMAGVCLTVCGLAVTVCLVILLASAERVTITDGEALRGYLCSPKGTIPPNTSLVLSVPTLSLPAAPQDSWYL